jgi:hypothetical protein
MSAGACIAFIAGATIMVLPTATITLSWTHSVEKTRWEEDYVASAAGVNIVEARIEALGAGMEPPASAARKGKWWHYQPALPSLSSVDLANSMIGGGYTVCWDGQCRPLGSVLPRGQQVSLTASVCLTAGRNDPARN